jgi:hypothetical protein
MQRTPHNENVRLFTLLFALALAAQPTFVPVSVEELCGRSDAIVDAVVSTVGAARANETGKLETPVEIAISTVLKGPPALKKLTLIEPGGKLGQREEVYFNQLIPAAGGRYILFLRQTGANYTALGGLHGHYRIVDGRIRVHPAMPRILKTGFAGAPAEKLLAEVRAELAKKH